MSDGENNRYFVKIMTYNISEIKNLFNLLKDYPEIHLKFDIDSIKINEQSISKNSAIFVNLNKDNFHYFNCKQPIEIGVNTSHMIKVLKHFGTSTNSDKTEIMTIFVESFDPTKELVESIPFGFLLTNSRKHESSKLMINVINEPIGYEPINLDLIDIECKYYLTLTFSDLHDIMNKLKAIGSDTCRIIYDNNKNYLSFYSKLSNNELCITRQHPEEVTSRLNNDLDKMNIISLYCKLSKLVDFLKCSQLADVVKMGLGNLYEKFILEYNVGALGTIKLVLSTEGKPDDW